MISVYFDPFTHPRLSEDEKKQAEKLICEIDKLASNSKETRSTKNDQDETVQNEVSLKKEKIKRYYEFGQFFSLCGIEDSSPIQANTKIKTIKQEITRFRQVMKENIKDRDTFEIFWQKNSQEFISLTKIMKKFSIIPATSVPSESSYSIAGFIQRKQRASMSGEMLKCSKVLKISSKHFDEFKEK